MLQLAVCSLLFSVAICAPGRSVFRDHRGKVNEVGEDFFSWTTAKGFKECEKYRLEAIKNNENEDECKPMPIEKICAEYECPKAKKMNSTGCGYETRLTYGAKWVATDLDDITDIETSATTAFWKLFRYISGENDQSVKMEMTVPVLYKWFLNQNYNMASGRMHFYIPAKFQKNTPKPTEEGVEIDTFMDTVTYDRAFGGHDASEEKYKKEFLKLELALADAEIAPYGGFSMTTVYTRPGPGRQRMEVMLVKGRD